MTPTSLDPRHFDRLLDLLDREALAQREQLGALIEHAQACGGYRSVWEWPAAM